MSNIKLTCSLSANSLECFECQFCFLSCLFSNQKLNRCISNQDFDSGVLSNLDFEIFSRSWKSSAKRWHPPPPFVVFYIRNVVRLAISFFSKSPSDMSLKMSIFMLKFWIILSPSKSKILFKTVYVSSHEFWTSLNILWVYKISPESMFVQYNGYVQNEVSTWLCPKFTRPGMKGVFVWLLCFGTIRYMNGIDATVL